MNQVSILLVEDEALIQQMVEDALADAGFAVTLASDGEEAIGHLDTARIEYRAVVTDVNLIANCITGWDVRATRANSIPTCPSST